MLAAASSLAPDEVRAYVAHIDWLARNPGALSSALDTMTPGERARFDRFRHEQDRLMFALGRWMARTLVGRELGTAPGAWVRTAGP